MKKKLVAALAAAGAVGASSAQSVSLYGFMDTNLTHTRGNISSRTQLLNTGLTGSRLGFQGSEDLGGGLKGGFWLESGINSDDGTGQAGSTNNQASGAGGAPGGLTFNRRSTVSMGGDWGELRLGRDYAPSYWNNQVYDPFGAISLGASQIQGSTLGGLTQARVSNSVSYLYGHAFNAFASANSGFNALVMHYLGENNSNAANGTSDDGTGTGVRLGYGAGAFSIAAAWQTTHYSTVNRTLAGDRKVANVGIAYDFGVLKISAVYQRDDVENGRVRVGQLTGKGSSLGAVIPAGPGYVRTALSTYKTDANGGPKTNKFAVGYVYLLSKRTALYANYARLKNSGFGAAAASQSLLGSMSVGNGSSSGYQMGIRHAF